MGSFIEELIEKIKNLFRQAPEIMDLGPSNRRRFGRFEYPYKVTVWSGVKSFESVCSDISMGGMKLKYPLPPSLSGLKCRVVIEGFGGRGSITFNSKILLDSVVPKRISFAETDRESLKRLEQWLMELQKAQG